GLEQGVQAYRCLRRAGLRYRSGRGNAGASGQWGPRQALRGFQPMRPVESLCPGGVGRAGEEFQGYDDLPELPFEEFPAVTQVLEIGGAVVGGDLGDRLVDSLE